MDRGVRILPRARPGRPALEDGRGPEVWTRAEAIGKLRHHLLRLTDEEHSICQVASALGIFCPGFRRWHDNEFHRRWKEVLGASSHLTRAQMEELANVWQLAEQIRHGVALACDAQTITHGACRGWNEFSNDAIAQFCSDIFGRNVTITERGDG